jgi:hypothetical protein
VAIDVSSDRDARVTEDLRDHFERHAGRQDDRGSRVPQSMQPNGRRQLGTLRRGLESRSALRRSLGWPNSVVKTYGVGCHIEPAISRSTLCLVRTSRNTFSAVGESGTTRRDFAVFVSVTTSSPSTRAKVPCTRSSLASRSMSDQWRASAPDRALWRQPRWRSPSAAVQHGPGYALSPCRARPYRARRARPCTPCGSRTQPAAVSRSVKAGIESRQKKWLNGALVGQ